MSSIASFFLLTHEQFEELQEIVDTLPKFRIPKGARVKFRAVASIDMTYPENRKTRNEAKKYKAFWDYLFDCTESPYEYKWSGYVLDALLTYLRDEHDIDLAASQWDSGNDMWVWYLLDQELKRDYLTALKPSNFRRREMKVWLNSVFYWQEFEQAGDAMMDGIRIIHNYLKLVDDDRAGLLHIG